MLSAPPCIHASVSSKCLRHMERESEEYIKRLHFGGFFSIPSPHSHLMAPKKLIVAGTALSLAIGTLAKHNTLSRRADPFDWDTVCLLQWCGGRIADSFKDPTFHQSIMDAMLRDLRDISMCSSPSASAFITCMMNTDCVPTIQDTSPLCRPYGRAGGRCASDVSL